jgi:hypothetical protein
MVVPAEEKAPEDQDADFIIKIAVSIGRKYKKRGYPKRIPSFL